MLAERPCEAVKCSTTASGGLPNIMQESREPNFLDRDNVFGLGSATLHFQSQVRGHNSFHVLTALLAVHILNEVADHDLVYMVVILVPLLDETSFYADNFPGVGVEQVCQTQAEPIAQTIPFQAEVELHSRIRRDGLLHTDRRLHDDGQRPRLLTSGRIQQCGRRFAKFRDEDLLLHHRPGFDEANLQVAVFRPVIPTAPRPKEALHSCGTESRLTGEVVTASRALEP
mmetsp:Transcript_104324/g.276463  ORF Transcript_104324/g.276463 Transcript_104324/m.276463 type:complete len:228 (+) Transcript_104324:293-976(+)